MDFEETVRFLEGSALFAGITPEQLRTVAASATIENHPVGSIVIEEDGASDYFYLSSREGGYLSRREAPAPGNPLDGSSVRTSLDH